MSRLQMTDGQVFPYSYYRNEVIDVDSPSACVRYFLNNNLPQIDVIQYDHVNNKCYGIQDKYIVGASVSDPNWSSLDLRPGYISGGTHFLSLAHQNVSNMEEQIKESSPAVEHCIAIVNGGPAANPSEHVLCSCYLKAASAIQKTVLSWESYLADKKAYKTFIDKEAAWTQRQSDERERLKSLRSDSKDEDAPRWASCGPYGPLEHDCAGDTKNAGGHKTCHNGTMKQLKCMYKNTEVESRVATWENQNPRPKKVDYPGSGPSDISPSIFQCCANIIEKDITIENSAQIMQTCSQTITLNKEEREKQDKLDEELQESIVNTKQKIEDLDDTKDTKSNTPTIIAIVVAIVIVILIGALTWLYFNIYKK